MNSKRKCRTGRRRITRAEGEERILAATLGFCDLVAAQVTDRKPETILLLLRGL